MKKENIINLVISKLTKKGKKSIGEKIFYNLLRDLKLKNKKNRPYISLIKALDNIGPKTIIITKKIGGARYQIPVPIKENKEYSIGLNWLLDSIKKKEYRDFNKILVDELMLAYKKEGEVVKKRAMIHKIAIDNIAFLKYLG